MRMKPETDAAISYSSAGRCIWLLSSRATCLPLVPSKSLPMCTHTIIAKAFGRALYLRLFEALAHKGFCNAYAGVALPNDGSVALHRSVGFEPIGVFKAVGHKFGK
jgi:hypothetical protein